MKDVLEINLNELPEFGEQISGEINPDIFELKEGDGKSLTGLKYDLNVQRFDEELLLRGTLSAKFEFICVRSLDPFVMTIEVPDFATSIQIEEEVVNPTDFLREEILILYPNHPNCEMGDEGRTYEIEEKYLALDKGQSSDLEEKPPNTPDDRWSALDELENL